MRMETGLLFPRHLAVLGTPYLRILQQLFGDRAVIPQAVELELRQASASATHRQHKPWSGTSAASNDGTQRRPVRTG